MSEMKSPASGSKNTLKSIGAVLTGFITVLILSTVTDVVLEKTGVFPPQSAGAYNSGLLLVALIYRSVYTVLGGFVTAKLAPSNPMKHVIILAVIGLTAGVIGVVAGWNLSAHWYPIALAITGPLFVYFGGRFELMKAK